MTTELWHHLSLIEMGRALSDGSADPRSLIEYFLSRIEADQESHKVFIQLFAKEARQAAQAAHSRANSNTRLSLYDGIPLAWKDNFDIAGKPTSSGIPALAEKFADNDSTAYHRAAQAGFICLGKTNMTELAFSGIGINPSYGTPRNPFDRTVPRVPGGSSCGSAVAVAKGYCAAAIGTDTGGSIRIPAAWNNLVGFKTTAGRIPTEGVVPLSQTLDTVGFLTRTVADTAVLLKVFTQEKFPPIGAPFQQNCLERFSGDPAELKFLLCENLVWDDIHVEVRSPLEAALQRIEQSCIQVTRAAIPEFNDVIDLVNTKGNIVHYEGFKNWGSYLNANPHIISPDILAIFNRGAQIADHDIQQVYTGLNDLKRRFIARLENFDAVLMPTVVHIPPIIAELEADGSLYAKENSLALRNTRLANLLGLCALSLPAGFTAQGLPVGLMLMGIPNADEKLLAVAAMLEGLLGASLP